MVLLLWIFYVFVLPCVCYVFVHVCLYVLCGHLLGKGWPLGSRLWYLTVSLSLSHWYPGSGVVLDSFKIPDLCNLTYFAQGHSTMPPVRLDPATPQSRVKHSTTESLHSLYFHRSSLIWVYTVCHRGFLNISAGKKSRQILLRLAH